MKRLAPRWRSALKVWRPHGDLKRSRRAHASRWQTLTPVLVTKPEYQTNAPLERKNEGKPDFLATFPPRSDELRGSVSTVPLVQRSRECQIERQSSRQSATETFSDEYS
jgi:hypothetical protein